MQRVAAVSNNCRILLDELLVTGTNCRTSYIYTHWVALPVIRGFLTDVFLCQFVP